MSHGPDPIEIPRPDELRDPHVRLVTILLVITALLSALFGFLHSVAERHAQEVGVRAQELAVEALRTTLRSQQSAQSDFEWYVQAETERSRRASARQQQLILRFLNTPAGNLTQLGIQMERWRSLSEQMDGASALKRSGIDGPAYDPAFPDRFFTRRLVAAERILALQDAANEEETAWKSQVNTFTAAFATFAVAAYLFGLSLTLRTKATRWLVRAGIALLTVALALAGWTAVSRRPHAAPAEAAEAYAAGREAFLLASAPAGYQRAREYFDRAIELRDTFALAYVARARAAFRQGSPQSAGYLSITSPDMLRQSITDLERARALGLENKSVLLSLGFQSFLRAMQEEPRDQARWLRKSVSYTRRALSLDPDEPLLYYNLGVALVADGKTGQARTAYEDAVKHTLYDSTGKERSRSAYKRRLVAGALTDLEVAARARPGLAATIREMKQLIVRLAWPPEPDGEGVPAEATRITLFPGTLQWHARFARFDRRHERLVVQWYYLDPQDRGWSVLPQVSGLVSPRINTAGEYFDELDYLSATAIPRCLPAGRYRVELYVNGRLSTPEPPVEEAADFGALSGTAMPDLNLRLCRPADWTRWQTATEGLADGYVSPDGRRGVFAFRFHHPGGVAAYESGQTAAPAFYLERVLTVLQGQLGGPPAYSRPGVKYFLGMQGVVSRWYTYPGGQLLIAAGLDADGAVIAGAVSGPEEYFKSNLAYRILDSLIIATHIR
jgi:tetratricopeptide (TPR) repeat protein